MFDLILLAAWRSSSLAGQMAPQGNNFDDFQFIGYGIRMDTHGYVAMLP